jgi:hypothetical protein
MPNPIILSFATSEDEINHIMADMIDSKCCVVAVTMSGQIGVFTLDDDMSKGVHAQDVAFIDNVVPEYDDCSTWSCAVAQRSDGAPVLCVGANTALVRIWDLRKAVVISQRFQASERKRIDALRAARDNGDTDVMVPFHSPEEQQQLNAEARERTMKHREELSQCVSVVQGHSHNIPCMRASPNKHVLATVSIDSFTRITALSTAKVIAESSVFGRTDQWAWAVAWYPRSAVICNKHILPATGEWRSTQHTSQSMVPENTASESHDSGVDADASIDSKVPCTCCTEQERHDVLSNLLLSSTVDKLALIELGPNPNHVCGVNLPFKMSVTAEHRVVTPVPGSDSGRLVYIEPMPELGCIAYACQQHPFAQTIVHTAMIVAARDPNSNIIPHFAHQKWRVAREGVLCGFAPLLHPRQSQHILYTLQHSNVLQMLSFSNVHALDIADIVI